MNSLVNSEYLQRLLEFVKVRYVVPLDSFLILLLFLYSFSLFPYGIFHLVLGNIYFFYASLISGFLLLTANIYHSLFEFSHYQKFIIGFIFAVLHFFFLFFLCMIAGNENIILFWFYPGALVFYCIVSPVFAAFFNLILMGLVYLLLGEYLSSVSLVLFVGMYFVIIFFAHIVATKICADKQELKKIMTIDSITGLKNHLALTEMLKEQKLNFLFQKKKKFNYVVYFDIENSKEISERFGHSVKDIVSQRLAKIVNRFVDKEDYLYRYGNKGFILFSKQSIESLEKIDELKDKISKTNILTEAGPIHICYGVAIKDKNTSLEDMMTQADKALLAAKITNSTNLIKSDLVV